MQVLSAPSIITSRFLSKKRKRAMASSEANWAPLTPLLFLERAAEVHPHRLALVYGSRRITWSQEAQRCLRLASSLQRRGIGHGDVVAVVAPNVPAMYDVQFGVPMASAVLNCINIRLDMRTVGVLLEHSGVKAVLVDEEFLQLVIGAISYCAEKAGDAFKMPLLVVIRDEYYRSTSQGIQNWPQGAVEYEDFLQEGDPCLKWQRPKDELDTISVCYTSGTTASPKGVMLSHRGAYLASLSHSVTWEMKKGSVYLWTLPLFHCNGWCFPWTTAALSCTNVCLRQVTAKGIFSAIAEHGVTNFCAAPTVLSTIINADHAPLQQQHQVRIMTAGAAPPAAVLAKIEQLGFQVTHVYGLTETYGPCTVCEWDSNWDSLPAEDRARLKARQGVRYISLEDLEVVNSESMASVPRDGLTIGEVVMKGNMVMKGYLNNPQATSESFRGGWFHSGDLGVRHPDGYIEIKDRAKDIIISGGENISSLEVESILYRHPAVLEAAVVARPDEKWGESPCAFVALKKNNGKWCTEEEIIGFCRERMPRFMVPKTVVVGALDKTATGKIQKHVLRDRAQALGVLHYPSRTSKL